MKLGIVDLDTSHPADWLPIERDLGHEIAGVWDGGSVHPPAYVRQFTSKHSIPLVYESLLEMARNVDCAIIHSCDWDTHVEKARPFIEAGRSVLIDKPFAGNPGDLATIAAWAKDGARIAGGSSLRYCAELGDWLNQPVADRGLAHTAFCVCGVDEFNYGIHGYTLLSGMLGPGIRSARHISAGRQRRIELKWNDDRVGILSLGGPAWLPFHGTAVTEKAIVTIRPDPPSLYRSLLEACLPYLEGKRQELVMPGIFSLEPELAAIAAQESWKNGDCEVRLDALPPSCGYNGAAFATAYRKTQYGG